MADTGAPWNLPYPLPTDLVKDGADDIKDLAEATAAGLTAAGGLVAVKTAIRTTPHSESSVATGASFAIPDLTITHAVADAANKLVVFAFVGVAQSGGSGPVGIALHDGTGVVNVGTGTLGNRTAVTAGFGVESGTGVTDKFTQLSFTAVHTPGDTSSRTYTLRAFSMQTGSQTIFINRSSGDTDNAFEPRPVSALTIMEVKV